MKGLVHIRRREDRRPRRIEQGRVPANVRVEAEGPGPARAGGRPGPRAVRHAPHRAVGPEPRFDLRSVRFQPRGGRAGSVGSAGCQWGGGRVVVCAPAWWMARDGVRAEEAGGGGGCCCRCDGGSLCPVIV